MVGVGKEAKGGGGWRWRVNRTKTDQPVPRWWRPEPGFLAMHRLCGLQVLPGPGGVGGTCLGPTHSLEPSKEQQTMDTAETEAALSVPGQAKALSCQLPRVILSSRHSWGPP